ncbi:methyl-accepting chemotaxis protein [Mangrovimicrobium sediminis]|uniref:Methyl-accepting chemotaxis protein n=1 Tax=Mangrovimicrobium sediminis TaxID=2562682 RepID=A0A4Z0M325_9GAMM|nr:methyl-accepting chemotaxis protein [Haliea sp. SAOS-164]TGD74012.1 methyl-accepting chemotaxis protein [Haliea sp. SAOS-164]
MTGKKKPGAAKLRNLFLGLGALACLGAVGYSFLVIDKEVGAEGHYDAIADQLAGLAREVSIASRGTARGEAQAFENLDVKTSQFERQLGLLDASELNQKLSMIDLNWQPVKRAVKTLVDAAPRAVFVEETSRELDANVRNMQKELASVVALLQRNNASADTLVAAQKAPWLLERMARNLARIQAGSADAQVAADEFRSDTADFTRIVEGLTRGDELTGIEKVSDAASIESLSKAYRLFSPLANSVDRIAGAATDLRQAAAARATIDENSVALGAAISELQSAVDDLAVGRLYGSGNLLALFVAPGVLAIGLLLAMFIGQRRRDANASRGMDDLNETLEKIARGDLTVSATEGNSVTGEIAHSLNGATARQCQLIREVRTPFEASVKAIDSIRNSARAQVAKGKELTRSVVESTETATEMVRTSEEIKSSTARAAETSDRNCRKVSQGYELTKDMSKASVDVRESVQETSKSAKRQSELIQSVTAAAEYIQTLNTKISVVAINTRIEAEKAGEYGRPFLGIAESIADLLREAEEEGRKIISEVRMLQNMSADNLASMETTVGTVVTILEYIERLDSSLEEINSGSLAISDIISSVDEAAGQSAVNALHMSSSMSEIRDRNIEISELNESAQRGVASLQGSIRDAARSLGQFRTDADGTYFMENAGGGEVEDLDSFRAATQTFVEEEIVDVDDLEPKRAIP